MNILYVGAFRLPKFDAAATRVLSIGKALKATGHTISFISWGGEYEEEHRDKNGLYFIEGMNYRISGDIDAASVLDKLKTKLLRGDKSMGFIKRMSPQPDIIITYNVGTRFNMKIHKYCKYRNIKLIGDLTEWYDNKELKAIDFLSNWWNMTKIYRNYQYLISISSYLSSYYSQAKSIVIPALADCEDRKWIDTKSIPIEPFEGITLIYAGTPAKKDSLHKAVAAVQKLIDNGSPLRFIIAGCEKDKYSGIFKTYYPELSLSSNIIFLGRIDQDKIPELYQAADFMILMREKNRKSDAGFPTKFTESMMSGTPVICNLTSDLGKYVTDGLNGFIVSENSVEACMTTLKDKVLPLSRSQIQEMKQNAKEIGLKKFDYRNFVIPLDRFINNLD